MENEKQSTRDGAPASNRPPYTYNKRSRLRALGITPRDDRPPFDIIGDVHGCIDELKTMLAQLGYRRRGDGYSHPEHRRVVFVGDLVDRGPGNVPVLKLAMAMRSAGAALFVLGNHDARFLRWLTGRNVRVAYGMAQTIAELNNLRATMRDPFRWSVRRFLETTPGYLMLDRGRLVVTHGGIQDYMIGSWDGETAHYCLYGELEGYTASGKPIRRDWGAHRRVEERNGKLPPYIVYGHNVVKELAWVNRTLDLDTGCVYGGQLSALRYPEMELVQVTAARSYTRHTDKS